LLVSIPRFIRLAAVAVLWASISLPIYAQTTPAPAPTAPARTQRNAGGRPTHNEVQRAARWQVLAVPYRSASLSARERQVVAKLADACRLMDQLYWQQSDLGGGAIYHGTRSAVLGKLFGVMGSRWDLLDDNLPFIGEEPMPAGHELYPYGLKREQIEQYAADHPEAKAGLYNPWTVVRGTPDHLETVPYHIAFATWLEPMAADLRAAAAVSPDPAFAKYLRLRADALLSDDYYASDVAWLDLKDPKIDLIFAPYETYLDNMLAVKTSYGGAILLRNDAESRKLALYREHEAAMQQALPLATADKPSKVGQSTPMEVVDTPLRAGDLRYGYQAVADNLPNDPRIHATKGSKKIFFKNFMDARTEFIILPLARRLMAPSQLPDISGQGYLAAAILHEISHGLGPAYAHIDGRQVDIREAIGPAYSGLEEAKADVSGIYLARWLADRKLISSDELRIIYGSYVAGLFRTLRFGTGEAHGRAEMMEFNVLFEQHAITRDDDGHYAVDYAAMPQAIAGLCEKLLTFEARGDRAGADAWFVKYDVMPDSLSVALDSVKDIPVDFSPEFELSRGVRP
jgi:hypothetical protein